MQPQPVPSNRLRDSVLALEHQTNVEERSDCQAFVKAFGPAIQAYMPETLGILLYPLQLLTSDVSLTALLGMLVTVLLQAVADRELAPAASIPNVSAMPVPQVDTKCWHHSLDQGVPASRQEEEETADIDDIPKEHPHHK